jgi:hypothetical protein
MQRSKRQDLRDQDTPAITVTRHAVQRHLLRARTTTSREGVVSQLRCAVQDAVDRQDLQQIDRSTFLAAVDDGSPEPLWAVLDVSGPTEKPFAIVVCTVLTSAMVTRSFEMKHQPRYAAA